MWIADWREGRSYHDSEAEAEAVAARKIRTGAVHVVVFPVPDPATEETP